MLFFWAVWSDQATWGYRFANAAKTDIWSGLYYVLIVSQCRKDANMVRVFLCSDCLQMLQSNSQIIIMLLFLWSLLCFMIFLVFFLLLNTLFLLRYQLYLNNAYSLDTPVQQGSIEKTTTEP
jgi:hypothetical protein